MARRRRTRSPFSLFAFQDIITSVMGIVLLLSLLMALMVIRAPPAASQDDPDSTTTPEELQRQIAEMERDLEATRRENDARRSYLAAIAGKTPKQLAEQADLAEREAAELGRQVAALQARRDAAQADLKDKSQEQQRATAEQQQDLARLQRQASALADELAKMRSEHRVFYNLAELGGRQAWLVELSAERILMAPLGRQGRPEIIEAGGAAANVRRLRTWLNSRDRSANHYLLLVKPSAAEQFKELQSYVDDGNFHYGFDLLGEGESAVDPEKGAAL